ncbi:MAG: methyltransferase domain-containing protein [Candidatus Zixiibacteriota bacterium]|jgi:demethylmenaquinone methyltransferase/2-methoxy-6-polyprenyl-1,4-benzoquinol methylase
MTNNNAEIHGGEEAYRLLEVFHPLREEVFNNAIAALDLPRGSRGLDAGCGNGLAAITLAEAVGPEGRVVGLDLSEPLLARGEELVREAGLAERVTFEKGDVNDLPFDDDSFDWAWSADCVGYYRAVPFPALGELARVVKPGGTVAILAWSSEQLLPGYPALEARLKGTAAGLAPFERGMPPARHFMRAAEWFRDLGLEDVRGRTFAGDACAPLSDGFRQALLGLFDMRWYGVEEELTAEERAEFKRLTDPTSPDFVLNDASYYAFFTYSVFWGKVLPST